MKIEIIEHLSVLKDAIKYIKKLKNIFKNCYALFSQNILKKIRPCLNFKCCLT